MNRTGFAFFPESLEVIWMSFSLECTAFRASIRTSGSVIREGREGHWLLSDARAAGVCAFTSDIPESIEVVEGAGFSFRGGDQADLERMLDSSATGTTPSVHRPAKGADQSQYLWPETARTIETTYYSVLGWNLSQLPRHNPQPWRIESRSRGRAVCRIPRGQA